MCVDFLYNFLSKIFLRRIQRDIVINVKTSSCEVPVILVGFQWNFFLNIFSKRKSQISNLIKIRPVRAEMFHADRRPDGWTDIQDGS